MKKIMWTDEEWNDIARWFRDNYVSVDGFGFNNSLLAAQSAKIIPTRHRPFKNSTASMVRPKVKKAMERIKNEVPTKAAEIVKKVVVYKPASLEDFTIDQLLAEINRRIKEALVVEPIKISEEKVDILAKDERFVLNPVVRADKKPKTKILVIGPKPNIQEEMRKTYKNLDIRFLEPWESVIKVQQMGASVQEIILWTQFISHSHEDHASKLKDVHKYRAPTISKVRDRLEVWNQQNES